MCAAEQLQERAGGGVPEGVCTFPPCGVAWSTVAAGALAKLLEDAGGLGDAFLQEQLTIASHPSSANEEC